MEKETDIVCCLPSILFGGIGGFFFLNEKTGENKKILKFFNKVGCHFAFSFQISEGVDF